MIPVTNSARPSSPLLLLFFLFHASSSRPILAYVSHDTTYAKACFQGLCSCPGILRTTAEFTFCGLVASILGHLSACFRRLQQGQRRQDTGA